MKNQCVNKEMSPRDRSPSESGIGRGRECVWGTDARATGEDLTEEGTVSRSLSARRVWGETPRWVVGLLA